MAVDSSTKRVLIIDDEEAIVTLIRDVLANFNYEPLVATLWTEAVDAIANQAPDLILLDLKMPTIDGSSLLEFIRDEGNQVPVIIVSGFITDEVAQNLSKFGVSGFVRKPFKVSQLKEQVDRVLGVQSVAVPPKASKPEAREDAPISPPADPTPEGPREPPGSGASKPPSIGSLYDEAPKEADEEDLDATPASPAQAPSEEEVLQILQKLDAPKKAPTPAAPPPPPPPPAEVISPPADAAPPAAQPAPGGQVPDLPADGQPAAVPESMGESLGGERRHRTHHRRHRPRRISRRSVLIYSAITVVCIVVAGFLAAIHWWESQGGLADIQTKAGTAVKEQLKQELLKELQNQKR